MDLIPGEVRVIGVGNLLFADEGVGVHVIRALERRPLPPTIRLIDGGSAGLTLLDFLEEASLALVIDTADMGLPPGSWRRFTPAEVQTEKVLPGESVHEADLLQVVALGQALGRPLGEVIFFGVQPAAVEFGLALTPLVAQAALEVEAAILDLLVSRGLLSTPPAP